VAHRYDTTHKAQSISSSLSTNVLSGRLATQRRLPNFLHLIPVCLPVSVCCCGRCVSCRTSLRTTVSWTRSPCCSLGACGTCSLPSGSCWSGSRPCLLVCDNRHAPRTTPTTGHPHQVHSQHTQRYSRPETHRLTHALLLWLCVFSGFFARVLVVVCHACPPATARLRRRTHTPRVLRHTPVLSTAWVGEASRRNSWRGNRGQGRRSLSILGRGQGTGKPPKRLHPALPSTKECKALNRVAVVLEEIKVKHRKTRYD
jgi:hypothetical protein